MNKLFAATNSRGSQPGVVIYAPQGSGKSTHAAALARHYRKTRIVDEWIPGGPLSADSIALTNVPVRGSVYLLDALDAAQIKLTAPYRQALAAARAGA
jgi:ATP/maltotriose-dependent transcriptional regulator MalT